MNSIRISSVALTLALLTGTCLADDPAPRSPAKIVAEQRRYEVAPDASVVNTLHIELQILLAAAIQSLGQQPISYSDTTQAVDVNEAYTLKKDGTKIPVSPSAIITQQRPGTSGAPVLSDQKQKVVIYPNVEVGDTLVSTRTMRSKSLIPGMFSTAVSFPTSVAVGKSEVIFTAPKALPLYFDAKDITVEKSTDGDKLVYTVHTKNETPVLSSAYVSVYDRSPYLFVSSFKSWDQFAKVYGAIVLPKIAVTATIQAKADEITAGVIDNREQVKKIYEWVSAHVRYVALEFGQGGLVPHDPEEVLVNAYGDCKDHATLLAALLKAKGIASDLVLIHASDSYTVPKVPVAASFNHMINYVPSLSLYLDSTQRALPFGYLARSEYGKTVLHVGATSDLLRQVPLLSAKDSDFSYSEHQKLAADGRLTAEGTLTASGVVAAQARREGVRLSGIGPEKAAADMLEKRGYAEATGRFTLPPAEPITPDYRATMRYEAPKQIAMLSAPFALSRGLNFENLYEDLWLGPIATAKYKKADIMPCYSGTGSEQYTLDLPAGKKLAALPADAKFEAGGVKYTAHWSQDSHSVTVKREIVLNFSQPLCRGSQRAAIGDILAKIKADIGTTIALVNE